MADKTVSSESKQDYGTSRKTIEVINNIFPLCFDLAATKGNSVCHTNFFSPEDDSLKQDWVSTWEEHRIGHRYLWLNSPFCGPQKKCNPNTCTKKTCIDRGYHNNINQAGIIKWMEKCRDESKLGAKIVTLTPADPQVGWYRNIIKPNSLTMVMGAREKFEGQKHPFTKPTRISVWGTGMTGEGYWDL